MSEKNPPDSNFMTKLATFIVDKKTLFFLLYIFAVIFCAFSSGWVNVENDVTTYLPEDTETRQGIVAMNDNFTTFATAQIMVSNVTYETADELSQQIADVEGVSMVTFDDTPDHYTNASALFDISFDGVVSDEISKQALSDVEALMDGYDYCVYSDVGYDENATLQGEMSVILIIAVVIIIVVLTLTSRSYAEVPVLMITFGVAAILNMGTNFLLGTISFVSNSVTNILQLALSLDYAIIFCNHFKEEHQTMPLKEAVIESLSKSIPEISSSSLTTIGGLVAMLFMQFKIGPDMAINLIKAVLFALLSVFVFMPGFLVLFGPWMEKTKHKNFVPKIPFVGEFDYKTRFLIPPIFLALVVVGFHFSNNCPYAYGLGGIATPKLNYVQVAENKIADNFGANNFVALVYPKTDYDVEAKMLAELDTYDEVDYSKGLSNVEAMDGYMLADKLNPRQFAELAGLDYEVAEVVYAAYAADQDDYAKIIGGLNNYKVPLIDMMLFVCDKIDEGLVTLDDEQTADLKDAQVQMESAKKQLQGQDYNRVLIYLTLPEDGDATYNFLDKIREIARTYYPDGELYLVGNSTVDQDFKSSFATDNLIVSVVSILIVLVVLLFTFQSAGMPILLILVIQGSIWINFTYPTLAKSPLFFLSYLVVSSIQMGANIDYAIVISSRYQELKTKMSHKEAIIETMNIAFPTILTSGSILASAGILIGMMTSHAAIVGIGQSLGRGTIISMVLVMFVLPQILLIGSEIVDKTSFSMPKTSLSRVSSTGHVRVDGLVRGEIHGYVNGIIRADINGDVDLNLIGGKSTQEPQELPESQEGGSDYEA